MLRVEKGYGAKRLMAEFPTQKWSLAAVKHLLQKIDATGSADRKTGSGRRRTVRTDGNVNSYFSKVKADLYETMQ